MPAMTTAPSHCTTMLVKNKFHGTDLCLISRNDPSDRVCFLCASALVMHKELWIHRILKFGKYYYNLKFKQTSVKNSGPGSLLMQVFQKKKLIGRNMNYHWAE